MLKFVLFSVLFQALVAAQNNEIPEYIRQCHQNDPQLIECFKRSLEHLKPYLVSGIPEIELPAVEPFRMDALSLQLTDGPRGYKITLKNMEAFGVSDFQVKSIKLSENGEPFQARIYMPKLRIEAKYTSSGVLLIIPASGGGDFHAVLDGVTADLSGKVSVHKKPNGTFLHIDSLSVLIDVDKLNMQISNAFHHNQILSDATNLFLRENGKVVFELMQPQLQKKLAVEFGKLGNQLLKNIPRELYYVE